MQHIVLNLNKNMKSLIFMIGCFLTICSTAIGEELTKEQVKEMTKKLFDECKTKSGATDADLNNLKEHKLPETEAGLCMVECVFETSGIMKDGKYTEEGMIKAFSPVAAHDETKMTNLKNLAAACKNEIGDGDPDKCKNAKLVATCFHEHAPKHSFELPEID